MSTSTQALSHEEVVVQYKRAVTMLTARNRFFQNLIREAVSVMRPLADSNPEIAKLLPRLEIREGELVLDLHAQNMEAARSQGRAEAVKLLLERNVNDLIGSSSTDNGREVSRFSEEALLEIVKPDNLGLISAMEGAYWDMAVKLRDAEQDMDKAEADVIRVDVMADQKLIRSMGDVELETVSRRLLGTATDPESEIRAGRQAFREMLDSWREALAQHGYEYRALVEDDDA